MLVRIKLHRAHRKKGSYLMPICLCHLRSSDMRARSAFFRAASGTSEASDTACSVLIVIQPHDRLSPFFSNDTSHHASVKQMSLKMLSDADKMVGASKRLTKADSPATTKYHGVTGEHDILVREYGSLTIGAGQLPSNPH